jgi:hypothetical protein
LQTGFTKDETVKCKATAFDESTNLEERWSYQTYNNSWDTKYLEGTCVKFNPDSGRWLVRFEDGDETWCRPQDLCEAEVIPPEGTGIDSTLNKTTSAAAGSATAEAHDQTQKKKAAPTQKKKATYIPCPTKPVFFLIDLETTGSKRNWDRVIEIALIAYNESGTQLGVFESRISNSGVLISPHAYRTHGISERDLVLASPFATVGVKLLTWMQSYLGGGRFACMICM